MNLLQVTFAKSTLHLTNSTAATLTSQKQISWHEQGWKLLQDKKLINCLEREVNSPSIQHQLIVILSLLLHLTLFLNCLLTNARSILNKFNELQPLVSQYNPHIIGSTETWLHSSIKDSEIKLDNYNILRNDRSGSRGGEVLLYVHKSSIKWVINHRCPASFSAKFLHRLNSRFLLSQLILQFSQMSSILGLITNDHDDVTNLVHLPPLGSSDHNCLGPLLWSNT